MKAKKNKPTDMQMRRAKAVKDTLKEVEDFALLMRTMIYAYDKTNEYLEVLEEENLMLRKKLKVKNGKI